MARKKEPPVIEIITIEVTLRGTIKLAVPCLGQTAEEILSLADECPIPDSRLPQEVQAQFEKKLAEEALDFDFEITDVYSEND